GLLSEYAGSFRRGKFWTSVSQIVLVLIPLSLVIALGSSSEGERITVRSVFDRLTWGLYGLVGCVVFLSLFIGIFGRVHGSTIHIEPELADDLNRLLEKVREYRARELIMQIDSQIIHPV